MGEWADKSEFPEEGPAAGDLSGAKPRRDADFRDPAPVPKTPPALKPAGTASSSRTRWVPPDNHPISWWVKHRGKLQTLEWTATALFLLGALYFLWLLLFTSPPAPPAEPLPPTREEFHSRLRALPVPAADPAWKVAARSGRWQGIVLHHTNTDGGAMESIDRYHRQERKWENGFGYHFLIGNGNGMEDGEIAVGRRWLEQDKLDGAHVGSITDAKRIELNLPAGTSPNSAFIGVALVGNFDRTLPTAKQLAALRGLLTFLRSEYQIGLASIVGHGMVMNTRCPGQWFFMEEVVLALANP